MGQIKNIKLHIVTDIKVERRISMMSIRKLPSWMNQSSGGTSNNNNNKNINTTTTNNNQNNKENDLPHLTFPGQVTYCYNKEECNFICNDLISRCDAKNNST